MARSLSCTLAALFASAVSMAPAQAAPLPTAALAGDWSGTLPFLPPKRVIVHVRPAGDQVRVTLDVPDLGVQGVPIQNLSRDGSRVAFSIPAASVRFDGELQPGGHELRGSFADHEIVQPLILGFAPSDAPPPPFKITALAAGKPPGAEQIRQVLKSEIAARQAVGLIVGVVGPDGRMIVSEGVADPAEDPAPIGADRPLFVESVVKAFTGLLLADMVQRGDVKLDDPLDLYLPAGVHAPERNGHKITLLDLATHTSGLPRGPDDFAADAPRNYPADQMHRALVRYQLTRDPGQAYEYSDWGSALLGDALARRAGMGFEALVRARITSPLGMSATSTQPTPAILAGLPLEHDSGLRPRPPAPAFADSWVPAYELYTTVDDLLRFLQPQLGGPAGPLRPASDLARTVRRPIGPLAEASLAWEVRHIGQPSAEVFGVSGGSRSMRAYVAFRSDTHVGVVVYSNASTAANPEDIGLYVLTGRAIPPPPPPIAAADTVAIDLPAGALDGLVGRYRLTPQMVINITAQGARLFGAVNDNPLTELFPSSPTRFFARTANAQAEFDLGADGRATGLRLKWNGVDMAASRIADEGGPR